MAKWGEGDPRWIVEDRPDATNVNNWHWTEKDASAWSKTKLKDLLLDLKVVTSEGECEVTEVSKLEGEASASNRKGKLIFFYEWVLTLEWQGNLNGCETKLSGKAEIPNLSDENDAEDVDVTITVKTNTEEANKLKDMMRKDGIKLIKEKLGDYIDSLKVEFSRGMILPSSKSSENSPSHQVAKTVKDKMILNTNSANVKKISDMGIGVKIDTKVLTLQEEFKCSAEDLYEVFTDPQRVRAFTRGDVTMELEPGGKFVFFDGNVCGTYVKLERKKQIVQRWRFKSWPDEHYSTVTLEFEQKPDHTLLKLRQTEVPANDFERTYQGWKNHFWEKH
ncbi:putative activator of 90 kDa heat shock protein ATPase-like 1-like [Apostichopus japonicus]|uniref:Putative activator of 90 kDa heat shock protein ATPase-like 1-like n=1 Tax=Stichopus japonicus TaxID=307972 RepID=A0A2G8K4M1_STIJA|nr:putative activator of 90 kDa heat shock protein ATPase-like 1-like [Apostichopus japonicus]